MIRDYLKKDYSDVKRIFWETSAIKEFSSQSAEDEFINKYLNSYLNNENSLCLVYEENEEVLGYILGDTILTKQYFKDHPYLLDKKEVLKDYPSHLHINLTQKARSKGIGSLLVNTFCKKLAELSSLGVHLLTAKGAKNVNFYLNLNFFINSEIKINEKEILLLSRKI